MVQRNSHTLQNHLSELFDLIFIDKFDQNLKFKTLVKLGAFGIGKSLNLVEGSLRACGPGNSWLAFFIRLCLYSFFRILVLVYCFSFFPFFAFLYFVYSYSYSVYNE